MTHLLKFSTEYKHNFFAVGLNHFSVVYLIGFNP